MSDDIDATASTITTATDTTSSFRPADYSIAPEDQHLADAILAMDPAKLPSPNTAAAGKSVPKNLTASALPPDMRAAVAEKIKFVPEERRAEAEHAAVLEAVADRSLELRSRTGFAESVPLYWHELITLHREYNAALAEFDRLDEERASYMRFEKDEDGQPRAVSDMSATRRQLLDGRQRELVRKMEYLFDKDGTPAHEGRRRLDKALKESVALAKEQNAVREEAEAASKLADEMLREERVTERAKALARHRRRT